VARKGVAGNYTQGGVGVYSMNEVCVMRLSTLCRGSWVARKGGAGKHTQGETSCERSD